MIKCSSYRIYHPLLDVIYMFKQNWELTAVSSEDLAKVAGWNIR